MDTESSWLLVLKDTVTQAVAGLIRLLPNVLGAIAVILAGWLLAKLLRNLAERALRLLSRALARVARGPLARGMLMEERSIKAVGAILYWATILLFLTAATQVLGLGIFTDWLSNVVGYLPALLAGLLILLAGFVFSLMAKDVVSAAASSAHLAYAEVLGRSVQILIFSMAVVIGIDQMGINVTFLVVIVGITLGMIFGGMALAFGLGSRQVVANILAAHYARQMYQIGDTVTIGQLQGRIEQITTVSVVLDTAQGRCHVPTALFLSETSSRLEKPAGHEPRSGT